MSGGNNYVVHTMRLLQNEKAIAGLSNVGGFQQAGQARYKCRNLSQLSHQFIPAAHYLKQAGQSTYGRHCAGGRPDVQYGLVPPRNTRR